jgi:hypothetical protein
VKETCSQLTEDEVVNQAFELMMAFDELISMGFREKLDVDQVHTILEMESHEENLQELIRKSKEEDARLQGRRKAQEIAVDRAKNQGRYTKGFGSADSQTQGGGSGSGSGGFDSGRTGISSSGGFGSQSSGVSSSGSSNAGKYTGFSSQSGSSGYSGSSGSSGTTSSQPSRPKSSMSLVPNKNQPVKKNTLMAEMAKTGEVEFEQDEEEDEEEQQPASAYIQTPSRPAVQQKDIHIKVEEKFRAEVNHEGGAKIDIKGEMYLNISDEASGAIRVKLDGSKIERDSGYVIKTHPKIDKSLYTNNTMIGLKNAKRPFPVGNLKVLTWTLRDGDEDALPFTVTCWPSPGAEGLSVSVEYELTRKDMQLNNVIISIPIPGTDVNVETIEHGTYKVDAKAGLFLWLLDDVSVENGNAGGSMEFVVAADGDESSTFPISVHFSSEQTLLPIRVNEVINAVDNTATTYSKESVFTVAEYLIV